MKACKMKRSISSRVIICALLAGAALLASCNLGSGAKAKDPKAVYTAAAETVSAQLTLAGPQEAASSATPFPSMTPPAAGLTQPLPTQSQLNPTAAATPTINASVADKAQYVSQVPADGSQVVSGAKIKMVWTVKNVGKTTWKTTYLLRFFAGNPLGGPAAVNLPKEVKPDEQVDVSVDLVAPAAVGEANTIWVLTNDAGMNFQPLTLTIIVAAGPSATPTVDQTGTAQACVSNPALCTPTPTVSATVTPTNTTAP
jgi:hypothetical protein